MAAEEAWLNSWERIRQERDQLMLETDWMILPDSPLSDADRDAVKAYRQALRDVPQDFAEPAAVEWPNKPAVVTEHA
ncbi:hypothetical protein CAI21_22115 [Alkalilimnicola ehrlichii]|uniref:Phage tail assembly chaperone-like domain-containing protein n=2 Tax=Alkalilimnicola ehrlichii TaxID=351052 RepID=A0A3E0WS18_9GAMM|nr:hypothetical protein CAI21_22115 [Alkalilimnicola ehrlichii]RFA35199.1 hypothetical protein CAL65_13535 [Alkalilimnicola ehrlichii]